MPEEEIHLEPRVEVREPGRRTMSLIGRWRIVEMDLWDLEAIDLVGPGFIEFGKDDTGGFGFIAVQGWMDCRHSERDGRRPCVEFTWDGDDEGDRVSGRGWAALEEDGSLRGHIWFHLGDDSGFRAVRARRSRAAERGRAQGPSGGVGERKARRTADPLLRQIEAAVDAQAPLLRRLGR